MRMQIKLKAIGIGLGFCLLARMATAQSFVNWENPQVHPVDITPDGTRLLVVNTADARLEVFDISSGTAVPVGSVPVGLDPVSVRAHGNNEAWVVNHISDSVSIVNLSALNTKATLKTADEPADVVFAGVPERAYVSCSQINTIQVFDPLDLDAAPGEISIDGEDPRAMAVSLDGTTVYVAVFESGNGSTILGGGGDLGAGAFPPNVVSDPAGPYGGQNPPPNNGSSFSPPLNAANPPPPAVGLIVKKDANGQWMDDNNGNWTDLVSGPNAALSGRPVDWDLPDYDLAIIDTATHGVTYASGLMNLCMDVAVNPPTGQVTVLGTDAINEVRFEPNLSGRFTRVNLAIVEGGDPTQHTVVDLNLHLTYATSTIPQVDRDLSLGDARGIVWNSAGTRSYVTGMGSNNLIVLDDNGSRAGITPTIEVGEGPTGLALDEARSRLYVLNRFEGSISVIDTVTETEVDRVPLFDPTPSAIRVGRKHLYDTHKNSGLGHIACASCHIDSRMDRLSWDLGDPAGTVKVFNQNCNFGAGALFGAPPCENWHPMKGPMTTQTLQDIIGKEPHHWRGDRNGIEEFNNAFMGLLGDDTVLTPAEMQQFENFLATITFPPNPYRNFDNTLPTSLPLTGHYTTGRFGPAGQTLPNGNAVAGLSNYRTGGLDGGLNCVTCHSLPTGVGSNLRFNGFSFVPFPTGPNGEMHHGVVSVDGSTNVSIKIPQLRNMYDKVGFEATQTTNLAGFGFLHDGSVDSLARFVSEPVFSPASDQEVADLVAFMLAFAGSDLPMGTNNNALELIGPTGKDTHAAVGRQVTVDDTNREDPAVIALLNQIMTMSDAGKIKLVAKGVQLGLQRGYRYLSGGSFQSDRLAETLTANQLRMSADAGSEITFTVVPNGTQFRIGTDRDLDGFFDRDELDACADPADVTSTPNNVVISGDSDQNGFVSLLDYQVYADCLGGPQRGLSQVCDCSFDFNRDGDVDMLDFRQLQVLFTGQ